MSELSVDSFLLFSVSHFEGNVIKFVQLNKTAFNLIYKILVNNFKCES